MTLLERLQKDIKAPFGFEVIDVMTNCSKTKNVIYISVDCEEFNKYKDSEICEHCGAVKKGGFPPMPKCKPAKKQNDKMMLFTFINDYIDSLE